MAIRSCKKILFNNKWKKEPEIWHIPKRQYAVLENFKG
jgi:hypothetical protein